MHWEAMGARIGRRVCVEHSTGSLMRVAHDIKRAPRTMHNTATCSVHHATNDMQRAPCSEQHAAGSKPREPLSAAYNSQLTTSNLQRACSVQRAACSVQHTLQRKPSRRRQWEPMDRRARHQRHVGGTVEGNLITHAWFCQRTFQPTFLRGPGPLLVALRFPAFLGAASRQRSGEGGGGGGGVPKPPPA
jgi:hypothetical protein